ncbi:MAG: hypothetical protein OFPI_23330 [Osedax symbiont Rs2]|nr:MAG: hypothetical protein OFPI_23330 [Osedax symbiont Rs2]
MDDSVAQDSIKKFTFPDGVAAGSYDCCLVFGSAHSQPLLAGRAAALYRNGKCSTFTVSGHAGEATDIGSAMLVLGVPSAAIKLESDAC